MPPPHIIPPPTNSQHEQRQAASAEAFQYNGNLPGLKMQAFGPTATPQYQQLWNHFQNGIFPPPPFPPYMNQNGFPIPHPPPPAALQHPIPPPSPQPAASASPTKVVPENLIQQPQPFTTQSTIITNNRVVELSEADKEEGELSEGDRVSESPASRNMNGTDPPRSVAQSQLNQPRSASRNETSRPDLSRRGSFQYHTNRSPVNNIRECLPAFIHYLNFTNSSLDSRPASSLSQQNNDFASRAPRDSKVVPAPTAPESKHSRDFIAEREKAKKLLSVLNDNRINYPHLVQEGLDPQILGELYNDLSISTQSEPMRMPDQFGNIMNLQPTNEAQPTESLPSRLDAKQGVPERIEPLPASSQNINPQNIAVSTLPSQISSKAPALNTTAQAKPVITANTNMNRNVPVKSAPSPIDRKDYIARLQAAKMGKQAATSKPAGHENLSTTSNATTATGKNVQAQPDSKTSETLAATDESIITAEKRKAQTELARQKMEALATRKTAPSTTVVSTEATPASLSRTSSFASAMNTSEQDQIQSERQSLSRSSPPSPIHENSAAIPSTISQTSNQATPSSKLPFGGIPGLFMTASPSTKPTQPQVTSIFASRETSVPVAARNRKRPVASDFDEPEELRQLTNGFKRPFGQSRHDHVNEEMIIEVSDDETAGSGMDMDDDQDAPEPPAHLPNNGNHTPFRQSTIRNLPPVPDLPSRATSVKPAVSAVSTPPAVQTPGSLAHVEDLKKREEEIAALRRRIAEAERRKAMSKGKQTEASRAQTPTTTQRPVVEPVLSSLAAATTGIALKNVTRSISNTAPVLAPSLPSSTSTETRIPRTDGNVTMCSSVSNPTQWKKIRRAEIESGLPSLDASLASNAARLEQLRKEMEQLEAENMKRMRDKENLIKELENLGIDTEGMPHEELQAKKDEIVQQRENEAASLGEGKSNPISFNSPLSLGLFSGPSTHSHLNNTAQDAHAITISEIQTNLPVSGKEDEELNCVDITSTGNDIDGQVEVPARENAADESTEDRADEAPDNISEASGDAMEMSDIESDKHDDIYTATNLPSANTESFEAAVPEKEPVVVVAAVSPIPSTPPQEDDAENFYSPEPVVTISAEGKVEQTEVPQGAHVSSNRQSVDMNIEEGEIEMSESSLDEGEDYEPIDTAPEPQEIFRTGSEDDYEPSDALPEFSPPVETESIQSSRATSPENKSLPPSADVPNIATADDLAPKLQPQTEPDAQGSITQPVCFPFPEMHGTNTLRKIVNKHTLIEHPRFVPYESPLRKFKSYRYHPEYSKDVSGGFRSMTYSHQIDPEKPICRFEAAGGTCNDDECNNQHFRGMGLDGAS
jgi:hypothetical protein